MYFMICLSKHGKHDHEYLRYLSGSRVSYYNILSQSVYGVLQCQRAYIDKRAHKYHGKTSLKHRHFHHGYYFRCHIILTVFTFCSLSITIFATKNCRCQVPLYYCCGGVPNPFYPPKKVAEITKIPKTAQKYSLLFIFTNLLIFVFMHFIYILYYFNCIYGKRYSYTGVTFKFLMLNLPFLIWNFQNQNKNYMQKRDTTSNFLLRN